MQIFTCKKGKAKAKSELEESSTIRNFRIVAASEPNQKELMVNLLSETD